MTHTNASLEALDRVQREYATVIEGLPPDLSRPLKMRFVHGMSKHAVSVALGISNSELEDRLSRAVSRCRQSLKQCPDFLTFVESMPPGPECV
jgi:DNA-directed RNA polymerase specialized sigma24 family protein